MINPISRRGRNRLRELIRPGLLLPHENPRRKIQNPRRHGIRNPRKICEKKNKPLKKEVMWRQPQKKKPYKEKTVRNEKPKTKGRVIQGIISVRNEEYNG